MDRLDDATTLSLLWKVIQKMRANEEHLSAQCLLTEEKLLHLSLLCLQRQSVNNLPFNFSDEAIAFVQKINRLTMENFKEENQVMDVKLVAKAADLLMQPKIVEYLDSIQTLGKLKVFTFNNLGCIYKKMKRYSLALRAVSYALSIQEQLLKSNSSQEKYQIIPTYLNKAAILSQMKKHDKAIEQISKSKQCINRIEREVVGQIEQAQNEEVRKRLEQKRYYGLYMKMLINYNMGVEKEHMKARTAALKYYQEGKELAQKIGNSFMAQKFESILCSMEA